MEFRRKIRCAIALFFIGAAPIAFADFCLTQAQNWAAPDIASAENSRNNRDAIAHLELLIELSNCANDPICENQAQVDYQLKLVQSNQTYLDAIALITQQIIMDTEECRDGDLISPIVIDLLGDGFTFSNVDTDPVEFDIDGDFVDELTGWTTADSDDAFLVFDRNANGIVDGGRELFGSATMLQNGELALNGYEALAELDSPSFGGNGDTVISKGDRLFKKLALWLDSNHNGVSERGEVKKLKKFKIKSLDTLFVLDPQDDSSGNSLILFSQAERKVQGTRVFVDTVDVYFKAEEF